MDMVRVRGVVLGLAVTSVAAAGQSWAQPAPVQTVPAVDLSRYLGDWYEVARYPNRFQTQCAGDVHVTYGSRPDGRVDVTNRCRTANGDTQVARGVARVVEGSGDARLKVRFAPAWIGWLPFVWGDYWIIGLDPDYRWAVVGAPGRDYLWVLSRTPVMDEPTYAEAVAVARAQGFDPASLRRTEHTSR
jgi:apolipoprotein D and lipocalin family protein